MRKMDVDQIHKIAFDEYQRVGHVTLSGELARDLFVNIPNREKGLEEVNASLHRRLDSTRAERDALLAYAKGLEQNTETLNQEVAKYAGVPAFRPIRFHRPATIAHLFDPS